MSDASSTTHSSDWSRRGSRQNTHGSSSVRLPHTEQRRTRVTSPSSAAARRRLWSGDCLSRWKVSRVAVFRPIPGSRASSAARSSIADTTVSEGKLEGQRKSAGQLLHLLLRQLRRFLLRFTYRDKYQVLQHFHVRRIHHRGIDFHGAHLSLSVRGH